MACPNPMTKAIQFVWKPNKCIWTSCEKTTSLFHLTQDPSTENWGLNTASKIQLELVFPRLTRMQKRQTLILFILASTFLPTNMASIVGYQFKDNKSWKRYIQGSSLYFSSPFSSLLSSDGCLRMGRWALSWGNFFIMFVFCWTWNIS